MRAMGLIIVLHVSSGGWHLCTAQLSALLDLSLTKYRVLDRQR